jgi:hypothetical protein
MLGQVTKAQQPLVSGAIRGNFTATTHAEAQVADQLVPRLPN